ncbi:MAG: rhomboid family intramembrane serine protease [Bacteroidetes bacterium]|nr:rhomboid family intramembrane serine protease [Bacteroidota bacterium]
MNSEKKRFINSIIFPLALLLIIWLVKFVEYMLNTHFDFLGIYPLKWEGLPGILFSPFIHADFKHLYANSIPLLILSTALFYFYREIGWKIFLDIYLTTNIWVWIMARPAWHIGASGLIYGLASFIFVSGIIRKHNRLMALSMFVLFLYGGLVWGIFPNFYQEDISWESHLMGLIAGLVYAFYFKNEGPQKPVYHWEEEDDNDDDPYYMVDEENTKNEELKINN